MQSWKHSFHSTATSLCLALTILSFGCRRKQPEPPPDHPRLVPGVRLQDVMFHSAALNRDMQYRVVLPDTIAPHEKLRVVYLLHGRGGGFRDWTNYSDVAKFAEQPLILVMPEGDDSYWVNSATKQEDRYEDYVAKDLIADVEGRFSVSAGRQNRAIAGVSMGGFGAVKLALSHPDLFAFAAGHQFGD
jgi:putative tributyrin esterase